MTYVLLSRLITWQCMNVHRFPDEHADGPVDAWLADIAIPPIDASHTPHVALVCLWVGTTLPPWMDYFVMSISASKDLGGRGSVHCTYYV